MQHAYANTNLEATVAQGRQHRTTQAISFRIGTGDVVGVARCAIASKLAIDSSPTLHRVA